MDVYAINSVEIEIITYWNMLAF